MRKFLSGNEAFAEGVRLARPQVISAYPITPQTTVVEALASMVEEGSLSAEYLHVESEHTALAAAIGAAATGARTFTATSSQGLLYMAECLTYASGGRFPIVMMNANRALALPWNIYGDQRDSLSLLDHGWIQVYAENNQEAFDLALMAYAVAEDPRVSLPVMVNVDGFALTHTYESVEVAAAAEADAFLPPYRTVNKFDFENPVNIGYSAGPEFNRYYQYWHHRDMLAAEAVVEEVEARFAEVFGRTYPGMVDAYLCEDADFVLVTLGSAAGLARDVADELRAAGKRAGVLRIRYLRPMPDAALARALAGAGGRGRAGAGHLLRRHRHGVRERAGLPRPCGRCATERELHRRPRRRRHQPRGHARRLRPLGSPGGRGGRLGRGRLFRRGRRGGKAMTVNARTITDEEFFYGHKACPGCGGALAVRQALKVLGPHAVAALPAGCMSATGFNFPQLAFGNNAMITPFAATAAVLSGIEAGLRAQGAAPEDVTVVGFAGDGGTADIGLQALSGAIDRNDDVLYICYDNEAYMNTGIQKSSLTPFGASTTTTPAGKREHGCLTQKKSLFDIVAAHRIPYAATASVGYLNDFIKKVERARDIKGTRFIHVMAPCPVGWGFPSADMVDVAREIVDTGLWYLAEYEGPALTGAPGGTFHLNRDPKSFKPIEPYLRRQGRFSADDGADLALIERARDERWSYMRETWG